MQNNTGFPLLKADDLKETVAPTAEQLQVIAQMDPHNLRSKQLKGNPAGIRTAEQVEA